MFLNNSAMSGIVWLKAIKIMFILKIQKKALFSNLEIL